MSFDGLVLRAVTIDLQEKLCGARIDKIYQPTKHEIILTLRQTGATYKLLLSSLAQEARVHLVSQTAPNPPEPPLFCMVLRKHLEGGKILSFSQPNLERILEINCEVIDELGDKALRKIIVEIMGKHSNILLIEPGENKIIDALRRIPLSISRYRQILPGLTYQSPPSQDKFLPWEIKENDFYQRMLALPFTTKINKALLKISMGMSPQTINELIFRTGLDPQLALEFCGEYELSLLWQELTKIGAEIKEGHFAPEVINKEDQPYTFSAIALTSFAASERQRFSTMNEALNYYYLYKDQANTIQQKKGELTGLVKKEIQRCEKKAALQQEAILEAENSTHYRLWGELLTANLHCLTQGTEAQVRNYYDPNGELISIPLLPHLTVGENAQRYFSRYQKSKKASVKAKEQLGETKKELNYLFSLVNSLENVTDLKEIEEIREEMRQTGYLKATVKKKNKSPLSQPSQPQKIVLDSWTIYIGKNNRQNDLLTMKIAKTEDLWLHTKDIPGSHVVIKNPNRKTIPSPIIEKAALLAAYHSQARYSTNVPVDYTKRQHVWKPQGAKPGFVLYTHQHTLFVTPDPAKIKELLNP
ncbi:MAG: fibronectin/fibrinogen-binding protein [Clostridia bacterium]|jgi:predicted ribosome quality control (RQC) complex YloA/Tae2 family protein|nr:fibronectin/fibrinogen-binding protein [Clostridia bacterium]